ncbi:MAG: hypothetical protein ACOX8B_08550 [Lachnospiraceae bacterium]
MKQTVIYDNSVKPNEIIREIIGSRGFGNVVVRRKPLEQYFRESIRNIFGDISVRTVNNAYDLEQLADSLGMSDDEDIHVIHCFSDFVVSDDDEIALTYKKLPYITDTVRVAYDRQTAALMFPDRKSYAAFLRRLAGRQKFADVLDETEHGTISLDKGLLYIGDVSNFIQCITGNFDSRYFNSLRGDDYILRKNSTDKKKIKSEYTFYHLLPENMQRWFVLPFDYRETDTEASYAMERLHMPDIAIRWVHGSINTEEFSELMDRYFYFLNERPSRPVSREQYESVSRRLYVDKVSQRIEKLKANPKYARIAVLLSNQDRIRSIDDIYQWYLDLKEKVEKKTSYKMESVIGHGDPGFANALYNRSTKMLKFVDPKGALTEEELWTNPYYDVAKLSHCVCGLYDFFNNAMFDISIDENFGYQLSIPFDNTEYKRIFREKAESNGYDFLSVRLYEASLFISMLPLHMDYPQKVFGFILNAVNILKEIEENV